MKKLFAFLLTFCLVFSVLPAAAAEEAAEVASGTWGDNITWVLTEDGTLTFSGEGEAEGYSSANPYPWKEYAQQVTKVVFEEGITNVPEAAFHYEYPNLVSAELKSVEVVGNSAFTQCYALTDVTLPDTLKVIEGSAFIMTGLTSVDIPAGVTEIGFNAFSETKLTEIVLPEGLLELGDGVFWGCKQLKSAYLPDSITKIGMHLFAYCTALETANIPANMTIMPDAMFDGCSSLKEIVIPDGMEYLYMSNFQDSGLVSVTIPASVKVLGSAFSGCRKLRCVIFEGDAPEIIDGCFRDVYAVLYYPADNTTWTEEKLQDYGGDVRWVPYQSEGSRPCDDGHHVPGTRGASETETGFCAYCGIPCHSSGTTVWAIENDGDMIIYGTGEDGAGQVDYYSYSWRDYRNKIVTLTVEEGVCGTIYDFQECGNLKSVSLSNDITEISKFAFALCPNLEQVNIPSSLTCLGSGAFQECVKLTEIILPATVSEIGSGVVRGCTSLETLRVDENNPYYFTDEQGVLYNMDGTYLLAAPASLTGHYTVPGTVDYIFGGTFWGCAKLTGVTISEGVQMLDTHVFKDCTSLKTVTFPDGLSDVGIYTFENCTALETVIFEGDAPHWFADDFFQGITATVYYPADNDTWTEELMQDYGGSITWVPRQAEVTEIASGWSGATQWTLTSDGTLTVYGKGNMKNYGYTGTQPWAKYADQIKRVVVEEGVTAIGTGAFMNLPALKYVTLPSKGLTKIGEAAFYGCAELREINIPEGIYTIWAYTFKNCSRLSINQFPSTLIKIDQGAFENSGAHNVTFPENLNILGSWSFKGCTGLLKVDLSNTKLTKIREGAFKNCRELVTVVLPRDIQILGDSCFYGIAVREFTVPETVTSIEPWCFARARYLKEIIFLGDAPSIGEGAFNKITLTARYPRDNTTWTEEMMLDYGGIVSWLAS